KRQVRFDLARARTSESGLALMYVNQAGGQDQVVFDGSSFVINPDHTVPAQAKIWGEDLLVTEWSKTNKGWHCEPARQEPLPDELTDVYEALVTGLRDYVTKNRFPGVVLGLSGGIDSALA